MPKSFQNPAFQNPANDDNDASIQISFISYLENIYPTHIIKFTVNKRF